MGVTIRRKAKKKNKKLILGAIINLWKKEMQNRKKNKEEWQCAGGEGAYLVYFFILIDEGEEV